jgi:hypothetical protein
MGDFDQAARWTADARIEAVLQRLRRETGVLFSFQEWTGERATTRPGDPERSADHVLIASEAENPKARWLLVFEFQTEHDPDKLDGVLLEVAPLRVQKRHGPLASLKYRVLPVFVYLTGTCPERELDMRTPSGRGVLNGPVVWEVAGDDAAGALEEVASGRADWGLLFWVALMMGAEDPKVIARWMELALAVNDGKSVADLVQMALVFAELAGRSLAWRKEMEARRMEGESQVMNAIRERAAKKAVLQERRENLLRLLRQRFPGVPIPDDVRELVTNQDSLDLLQIWFDLILPARTMDEYRDRLRQ